MYLVLIKSSDGTVSTRTYSPDRLLEQTLQHWRTKGFWIQEPLPGMDRVYRAFRNGREACKLTIKEVDDGRN